ncbi:MAG: DUF4159 domain-containing protein [Cyanobacteria bacterium]|nr:DUF4159 domain-containing protein [Cyanobacteriota bacterium]
MRRRAIFTTAVILGLVWIAGDRAWLAGALAEAAQVPVVDGSKFAGLKWTFVRIKYGTYDNEGSQASRLQYWDEPWAIDAPAAEQNLSRRIKSVTAIDVGDPIVLTLEDPKLWENPWIYIVEPSNLVLKDTEVPILREFLLRGGTLTFDDFHGPYEWELFDKQMKRVFPDREIVEIAPPHPIYSCFYRLDKYPQIPGLGSFLMGRTWEKGGFTAHLRGILDDKGRPMVLINWNTDMGDGVEWSNAAEYQGYLKWTAQAYQMLINEVIYSLTH